MSTEWYARLEKGHIGGVSEDVASNPLARALHAPMFDPQLL